MLTRRNHLVCSFMAPPKLARTLRLAERARQVGRKSALAISGGESRPRSTAGKHLVQRRKQGALIDGLSQEFVSPERLDLLRHLRIRRPAENDDGDERRVPRRLPPLDRFAPGAARHADVDPHYDRMTTPCGEH